MEYLDPASSDEDYFPTAEELEFDDDETIDTDDDDEDEQEVDDPNDADSVDQDELANEAADSDVEPILFQTTPDFLRQMQQVLQHGIRFRGSPSPYEDSSTARRPRRPRLFDL